MKSDPIDLAYQTMHALKAWYEEHAETVVSEADARLKLIDEILMKVLGWTPESIQTEEDTEGGRLDYRLNISDSCRVVVEAKRAKVSFAIPDHRSGQAFKLNGPVFKENAAIAIKQVIPYCAYKGGELACCTNGSQWIVFRANRLGDGRELLDGKGFVFSSINTILENFSLFYDLIAREAVSKYRFRGIFSEAEGLKVRISTFFESVRTPSSKSLLQRDPFSIDFDNIMSSFFHRLRGEEDKDMIKSCFVVTKESEVAENRIARIADDLVNRIRDIDSDTGKQLTDVIKHVQRTHKNRFVLLVGNKGCGKSTFVDRFFSFVLDSEIYDGLVVVRVDLSKCPGDPKQAKAWLDKEILEECESSVYGEEGPNWKETIGAMFWKDYKRWRTVTKRTLYETEKSRFDIEFGEHVEKCRETDPHDYIRRLLANIVHSRKKVPFLVFDNTDHHSIEFQEAVFQYARSIYESELSMMLMPITDRTSWNLSRQGVLQSFENEVFYLPVPPPYRVLERRITYLSERIEIAKERKSAEYFIGRNIRLSISDIEKFAHALNELFVNTRETSQWMGALVNHDVRKLLEIIKDVVSSPHLPLERLFSAHIAGSAGTIEMWRVKQALIKRQYDIYPTGEHIFVQNIFDISGDIVSSPLLAPRILQFLRDVRSEERLGNDAWIDVSRIHEYFIAMGFDGASVSNVLQFLLDTALILNYDPTVFELDKVTKVEISPSGKIHLLWSTTDEDYIKLMGMVTRVRDEDCLNRLKWSAGNLKERWSEFLSDFVKYLLVEDESWCTIPSHRTYLGQEKLTNRLNRVISDAQRHASGVNRFTRFNRGVTESRSG